MGWGPDYTDVTTLKSYLDISVVTHDAVLSLAITAASRAIDQFCNRQFGLTAVESRTYTAEWDRRQWRWVIPVDDLAVSGYSATVSGNPLTVTACPANASNEGKPWTQLVVALESTTKPTGARDEVTVTGRFGWSSVPVAVQNACLLQAARIYMRKDAPFGISGSPDLSGELRLLAKIDADVSVILQPYVRWWGAA